MLKLDLRKELKYLYAPSAKKVGIIEVPCFQFAMIDGQIETGEGPSTSASFQEALQALYGISYTLKFTSKLRKENPIDYPVMALEGLWWVKSGEFSFERKEDWLYTLMMLQPDFISAEMYGEALQQLRKKRGDNPTLAKMRLETFEEHLSMQIMHVGPYADEPATIARMTAFAVEYGYRRSGKHHEIYLGDPRRADPAKLKTVLRHPIKKTS
jgi:hypothetical protein